MLVGIGGSRGNRELRVASQLRVHAVSKPEQQDVDADVVSRLTAMALPGIGWRDIGEYREPFPRNSINSRLRFRAKFGAPATSPFGASRSCHAQSTPRMIVLS